jgi:hypothetical protein
MKIKDSEKVGEKERKERKKERRNWDIKEGRGIKKKKRGMGETVGK